LNVLNWRIPPIINQLLTAVLEKYEKRVCRDYKKEWFKQTSIVGNTVHTVHYRSTTFPRDFAVPLDPEELQKVIDNPELII
jgi:hypothetical protein